MPETQLPLEERFSVALSDWKGHLANPHSSMRFRDCADCEAFRTLVSLGKLAMPFIFKEISKEDNGIPYIFWNYLVSEIPNLGFPLPKYGSNESQLREHLYSWLQSRGDLIL